MDDSNAAPDIEKPTRKNKNSPRKAPEKFSLGLSVVSPEIFTLNLYTRLNKSLALRFFFAPTNQFKVKSTIPSLLVSDGSATQLTTNPTTITVNVAYGPHFGGDFLYFPFGSTFYLSSGISFRTVAADTSGEADLTLCSSRISNCTNGNFNSLKTNVAATGSIKSDSFIGRLSLGWKFKFGKGFYFDLNLIGLAVPLSSNQTVDINGYLTNDNLTEEQQNRFNSALGKIILDYESSAEQITKDEMAIYESQILPIIGIGMGVSI